ncbi:hypothetical protein GGI43DRAFT_165295 [Trichoderma evansii]
MPALGRYCCPAILDFTFLISPAALSFSPISRCRQKRKYLRIVTFSSLGSLLRYNCTRHAFVQRYVAKTISFFSFSVLQTAPFAMSVLPTCYGPFTLTYTDITHSIPFFLTHRHSSSIFILFSPGFVNRGLAEAPAAPKG